MGQPFAAALIASAYILHHHGIAAAHITEIGLCAVIFVVGCPDKQCGNGQRRSLGQINVRGELHAVAHRHVERTQHGNTVKRTGGIILPQRQRRIFLEAVAHQKIGLFPAGAEPCDEPPVPEQRVTGKFDAALDVIEQPVPLCAGIAQAIDGKFRRSTGCCRFKLGPQRQQPVRLQLNGGIVCVILCCHGLRLGKIEPQYIPTGMCNVCAFRGKAGQSNAGGVKCKRFFHFITPAFG